MVWLPVQVVQVAHLQDDAGRPFSLIQARGFLASMPWVVPAYLSMVGHCEIDDKFNNNSMRRSYFRELEGSVHGMRGMYGILTCLNILDIMVRAKASPAT